MTTEQTSTSRRFAADLAAATANIRARRLAAETGHPCLAGSDDEHGDDWAPPSGIVRPLHLVRDGGAA